MFRLLTIITLLVSAAFAGGQEVKPPREKHKSPPLIHLVKGVVCSPFSPDHHKFPRGLKPTPKAKRDVAKPFAPPVNLKVPAQVLMLPSRLDEWGNDTYGDCVSASEAARIAAWSVYCGLPETFIPTANVVSWAQRGGYLDGANLTDVMSDRQTRGMVADDGKTYVAGPYTSVDFTSEATLQAALAVGSVNFGIDANALPSAAGNYNGWYAFGGTPGSFSNEDHCTPSFGYISGSMSVDAAFKAISKVYGVTVTPPANAPTGTVYLWYTWKTVGVVDYAWIMSTAGEAYVQNPTTVGQSPQPDVIAPIITSSTTAAATVGQPFSYQITASNSPTSFGATGLPAGLSVNASGVVSGTPTAAGDTSVVIAATNAAGTGIAKLTLTVTGTGPTPPNAQTITVTLSGYGAADGTYSSTNGGSAPAITADMTLQQVFDLMNKSKFKKVDPPKMEPKKTSQGDGSRTWTPSRTVSVQADFEPNIAKMKVYLPADAKLYYDGLLTKATGPIRVYETPPLSEAGIYELRIVLGTQEELRTVRVEPGKTTIVQSSLREAVTAQARPFDLTPPPQSSARLPYSKGPRLGEVQVTADVSDIERQVPFLKQMVRYSTAKNTQSIYKDQNGPRLDAVSRTLLKQKWQVPGGMEGINGWRSTLYKHIEGGRAYQTLLPVFNGRNDQDEWGWSRRYADGTVFADVLSNDQGKVFEVRLAEKVDGRWQRYVAYRDSEARPSGYAPIKSKDCVACHSEAGSGGYGVGLVPGGDTVISDPFRHLE